MDKWDSSERLELNVIHLMRGMESLVDGRGFGLCYYGRGMLCGWIGDLYM